MAESKSTYEVELAGMPLKLRSSHDQKFVDELICLVDEKVNDALKNNSNVPFQKALLLASLHLAEDLLFLKKAARSELDRLEARTHDILTDLESSPIARIRLDV